MISWGKVNIFLSGIILISSNLPILYLLHFNNSNPNREAALISKSISNSKYKVRKVNKFTPQSINHSSWFSKLQKQLSRTNINIFVSNKAKFAFDLAYGNYDLEKNVKNHILQVEKNTPVAEISVGANFIAKLNIKIGSRQKAALKFNNLKEFNLSKINPNSVKYRIIARGQKANASVILMQEYSLRSNNAHLQRVFGYFDVNSTQKKVKNFFTSGWGVATIIIITILAATIFSVITGIITYYGFFAKQIRKIDQVFNPVLANFEIDINEANLKIEELNTQLINLDKENLINQTNRKEILEKEKWITTEKTKKMMENFKNERESTMEILARQKDRIQQSEIAFKSRIENENKYLRKQETELKVRTAQISKLKEEEIPALQVVEKTKRGKYLADTEKWVDYKFNRDDFWETDGQVKTNADSKIDKLRRENEEINKKVSKKNKNNEKIFKQVRKDGAQHADLLQINDEATKKVGSLRETHNAGLKQGEERIELIDSQERRSYREFKDFLDKKASDNLGIFVDRSKEINPYLLNYLWESRGSNMIDYFQQGGPNLTFDDLLSASTKFREGIYA